MESLEQVKERIAQLKCQTRMMDSQYTKLNHLVIALRAAAVTAPVMDAVLESRVKLGQALAMADNEMREMWKEYDKLQYNL